MVIVEEPLRRRRRRRPRAGGRQTARERTAFRRCRQTIAPKEPTNSLAVSSTPLPTSTPTRAETPSKASTISAPMSSGAAARADAGAADDVPRRDGELRPGKCGDDTTREHQVHCDVLARRRTHLQRGEAVKVSHALRKAHQRACDE